MHAVPSWLLALLLAGCGAAATGGHGPVAPVDDPDSCAIAVRVEDAGTVDGEDVVPRMALTVVRICEDDGTATAALPIESGVCTPAAPERGALAAATCWWAGAGAVIEVVRVGDELVARRIAHDEEAPPGPAVEVARVPLPPGAETEPLGR